MYEVNILKEGYSRPGASGTLKAGGSITLLKGSKLNILVDTGGPGDKDLILQGLNRHKLSVSDIHFVVCSHGHSDHVGNLNLFPEAVHVVGFDICRHDEYVLHDFKQGIPYEIDEDVEVWPTPGHTGNDVSVVVHNTKLGTVVVAGDLFECEDDLDTPSLWQENSERPHQQEKGRIGVLRVADWIVPGHGPMFQVPKDYKQQLRVVMIMEESSHSHLASSTPSDAVESHISSSSSSSSTCIIVETD